MNFVGIGWGDIATILGLIAGGGGAVWAMLRAKLGMDFAPHHKVEVIDKRLTAVEQKMAALPTHEDLRRVSDRLGEVERLVGAATVEIRGIRQVVDLEMRNARDLLDRVDRRVSMLFRHELDKEAKEKAP